MSERGSFVTEYCDCEECFEVLKNVLLNNDKFMCSRVLEAWIEKEQLPIIAGKVGGNSANEEVWSFMVEYGEKIEERICHKVRVAVIPENGDSKIFVLKPMEIKE